MEDAGSRTEMAATKNVINDGNVDIRHQADQGASCLTKQRVRAVVVLRGLREGAYGSPGEWQQVEKS